MISGPLWVTTIQLHEDNHQSIDHLAGDAQYGLLYAADIYGNPATLTDRAQVGVTFARLNTSLPHVTVSFYHVDEGSSRYVNDPFVWTSYVTSTSFSICRYTYTLKTAGLYERIITYKGQLTTRSLFEVHASHVNIQTCTLADTSGSGMLVWVLEEQIGA